MPAAFRTLLNPTGGGDPYFSAVSLLLHFDGTNGSTTFTDSSSNALTVTAVGNAQITSSSKFGTGAATFDGNGDYLTIPDNALLEVGSGDFTIEAWVYITSSTGFKSFVSKLLGFGPYLLAVNGTTFVYYLSSNGTSWDVASGVSGGTVSINTWTHLALVRNGSTVTPYLNGTAGTSTTTTATLIDNSHAFLIGADQGTPAGNYVDFFNGRVDELRFTKGVARYTANFTPPTAAFPDFESTPPADPYFSSTSLLLHMDGTNGSTTFVDSGPNALAVTASGNAQITSSSKFGTGAATFDGNGDYLETATNPVDFGTGDFTVECWIYLNSVASSMVILRNSSSSGFFFRVGQSYLSGANGLGIAKNGVSDNERCAFAFAINTWYHVAVIRQSGVVKFFVNGTQQTTTNSGYNGFSVPTTGTVRIGLQDGTSTTEAFNGLIDDLRVTKGVARTITVPTKAYPDLYNPYTTLPVAGAALWLDASQQSSLFTDAGATNVKVDGDAVYQWNDLSGNSRTATQTTSANRPTWLPPAKGQNGFSATSYDGTNDFFSVSNTENWGLVFSGDFTIDLWAKFTDNTAQQDLLGQDTGGGQQPKWILGLNNPGVAGAGVLGFLYNLNASQNYTFGVSWTPANNTLYRITVTRSGDDTKFYINGTQQGATVTSANRPRASTGIKLCVGTDGEGYRFTKGQFNEVLFFPFAYSASNMTAMSAYSLAKWGVS